MPIQIIDNFELTTQKPIDNRFVVGGTSFYSTRYDIVNTYTGLRIWDLNDGQAYVYDGATWSSEASLTTIQGTGTANYLPRFNTSNSLANSIVYQSSNRIGILNTSPTYELDVTGSIRATGNLYGVGTNITALNATNVTSGILSNVRLENSTNTNWILSSGAGGVGNATWFNPSLLSVGSAATLTNTRTLWGQPFNGSANVSGTINMGNAGGQIINATLLKFLNSTKLGTSTIDIVYSGTSNIPRTYTIPGANNNRTFALLEQQQTFTGQNTFTNFNNFTDNIQVGGTSSFNDTLTVNHKIVITFPPPIGNVTLSSKPLETNFTGIKVGDTGSYVTTTGAYTWVDDTDTGMFRGATYGSIYLKSNNKTQMTIGNAGSATFSTVVEQYATPGISMMSVLDVFSINNFDNATYGAGVPKFVWLTNSPWASSINADLLPYTVDSLGTSGPGSVTALAGIPAVNYDRLVSIYTGGRTSCYLFLETNVGSGSYYTTQVIFKDCQYTMIIPAGRKWKLCGFKNTSNTSITVSGNPYVIPPDVSNSDDIQVFIYKYGMN